MINKKALNGEGLKQILKEVKKWSDTASFEQAIAADEWIIQHNLNKYPSVTVVDSAGTKIVGDIKYVDKNNIIIKFTTDTLGTAYLN
jgi:hypothetical protein